MAVRRSYEDGCTVAHALDLIGERWALLVVRELVLGPKRFTDLRDGLPGASPNILAQRLRELEADGLVLRRKLPPPASSWVYELTERGHGLEGVILELALWGGCSPSMPRGRPTSADATVLLLRARFRPSAAADLSASYELRLGEYRFQVVVADRQIRLARGGADQPDAIIDSTPAALQAVVTGRGRLADKLRGGEMRVYGDQHAAERFVDLFAPA